MWNLPLRIVRAWAKCTSQTFHDMRPEWNRVNQIAYVYNMLLIYDACLIQFNDLWWATAIWISLCLNDLPRGCQLHIPAVFSQKTNKCTQNVPFSLSLWPRALPNGVGKAYAPANVIGSGYRWPWTFHFTSKLHSTHCFSMCGASAHRLLYAEYINKTKLSCTHKNIGQQAEKRLKMTTEWHDTMRYRRQSK